MNTALTSAALAVILMAVLCMVLGFLAEDRRNQVIHANRQIAEAAASLSRSQGRLAQSQAQAAELRAQRDASRAHADEWRTAYLQIQSTGTEADTQPLPAWTEFLRPEADLPVAEVADTIAALERHANKPGKD